LTKAELKCARIRSVDIAICVHEFPPSTANGIGNEGALKIKWNGNEILHLKRSFLDTNGAAKKINVIANVDRLYANNVVSFNKTNFL
jgi:hypothetical protein